MLNELAETVVYKLEQRGLKLAVAESCTGGMLAQYITSVSGASEIFELGIVSYSNRIKEMELDVNHDTLEKFGAVSSEVCEQMAMGILKKADADISAAVTGIAGPLGGTKEKPVGTVYIAVATKSHVYCKRLNLNGDRREIRENSIKNLLSSMKDVIDTL